MKKLFLVLVISLFCVISLFAQNGIKDVTSQKIDSLQQQAAKKIHEFKDELGLSEKQVTDLKKLSEDSDSLKSDSEKRLMALYQEYNDMLKSDADLKVIRKKLEDISKIQVDFSCKNIEFSRRLKSILTAAQMEKWQKIQQDFRTKLQAQAASEQKK